MNRGLFHVKYRNITGSGWLYLNNWIKYSTLTHQYIQVTFCHYPEIFQDPLKYEKKISLNFHHFKISEIYFKRAILEYFRNFCLRDECGESVEEVEEKDPRERG